MMLIAQMAADPSAEATLSFAPLFIKTVIVTVFIVAAAIVSMRYFIPRLSGYRRNRDSKIQILDFQPLDARKAIYIVKIENKKVAIGTGEHGVQKICDLE
jgi:flagellar biogenesis protein FliO